MASGAAVMPDIIPQGLKKTDSGRFSSIQEHSKAMEIMIWLYYFTLLQQFIQGNLCWLVLGINVEEKELYDW